MAGRWLALAFAVLLAGCAGDPPASEGKAVDAENGAQDVADQGFQEVETSVATGGITGVVVDEAIRPLADVNVTLVQASLHATTDAEGLFAFEGLEPGAYSLAVEASDYVAVMQTVTVEAETATKVKVVLISASAADGPYHTSYAFRGFMDAYVGLASWAVELFLEPVSNQTLCQCSFPITVDEHPVEFVLEGLWTESVPDASGLGWYWEFTTRDEGTVQSSFTQSPMYALVSGGDYPPENFDYTARLTGPWAGVLVQQHFDLYVTVFYRDHAPEGWSLLNGDT
jgi:hypothetical protein